MQPKRAKRVPIAFAQQPAQGRVKRQAVKAKPNCPRSLIWARAF